MCDRNTANVFTFDFLTRLADRDRSGSTFAEAEFAGPWRVEKRDHGFAVLQRSDGRRDLAKARFTERETALLFAAVYPLMGREQRYRLTPHREAFGFDVETLVIGQLETVGWLRYDHPELLDAVHAVEWLLRSPASLAMVLEAASYEVLAHAGEILELRRSDSDGEERS